MHTKSYVTIRNMPIYCHSFERLPGHILHKHIGLSDSKAINNDEFFYFYDNSREKLFLRYFNYNHYPEEYWTMLGIGELVYCNTNDFIKRVSSLFKDNKLFFPVVAPMHHHPDIPYRNQVRYFPMPPLPKPKKKNFLWDSTFQYIFVPTDSFVNSCKDVDEVFDLLKGHFRQYSDFANDENYIVHTDMYDLSSDSNFIEPKDCQDCIQVIGYENAKKELQDFDIEECLRLLSFVP